MSSTNSPDLKSEKRLSLTFHRTFWLKRDSIMNVVKLAAEKCGTALTRKIIQEETNLGSIYVESMPRYAFGTGLLNKDLTLTEFGKVAYLYDRPLSQPASQWLMHYFMSNPFGPGPIFWYGLVKNFFLPSNSFLKSDLIQKAGNYENEDGERMDESYHKKTARAFLGSYLEVEGLQNLGLLQETRKDQFTITDPIPASFSTMAVALLDYWQSCFIGRRQVTLDELIEDNEFPRIFMIGTRRMNRLLEYMQAEGYIDLYFTAPPYTAVLLRTDTRDLLEKMYTENETF